MSARTAVVCLPVVCVLCACGASEDPTTPVAATGPPVSRDQVDPASYDILFDFDQPVVPGDVVPGVTNVGTARVNTTVVTARGGALTWTPDRGNGWAVRAPVAAAEDEPVRAAAIVVWPDPSSLAGLDPGGRPVEMQVDFRADPPAPSRPGDDGDNLVQWGRFGDPAQLKLQLDHGKPSCRAAGTAGEVFLAAEQPVEPERWYRLSCSVRPGEVRMRLTDLEGGAAPEEWVEEDDPGELRFGTVPMSIGAKVGAGGRLDKKSADQFNGTIDRVVVDVR
ncbi:hypothetical protein [Nocardioides sp. J54]|uniref:hypothetical protein n=1 Tax=Nocardioides sp. J54 TaxID=935866 RepID=UPI000491D76D|nr:hypothetical protein [Nocardioides sp. J54]